MTTLAHTSAAPGPVAVPARGGVLRSLAAREARRYARHPLFLLGAGITTLVSALGPDRDTSSLFHAIVPAAALGLLGLVVMWGMARRSDAAVAAAGAVPVGERTRTLALAAAAVVPFAAGCAWWVWAMIAYAVHPPTPDGFPFGAADTAGWVGAVLFALGPLACVGGPFLGLLVARWTSGRAAPAVALIVVVAATIVMQGIIEPLRTARLVMPWTYWGGPFGSGDDAERMLVFTGSPYWWALHVACLSAGGLLLALMHDPERPRRPLVVAAACVAAVSAVAVVLAMTTGIDETLVNPVRSLRSGPWSS